MTLRMLGKNLLLKQYTQKQTKSGILLSQYNQDHQVKNILIVLGIGDEVSDKSIKVGSIVVIPRHTGHWVELENEKYVQVTENDILAVLETDESDGE